MTDQTASERTYVTIDRWQVYRVIDMPGLVRIDLLNHREARLKFTTAPGVKPVGADFIASEVKRLGGRVLSAATSADGYRTARYLRDTPYDTVGDWRAAQIGAIPDHEKCPSCKGSGRDVILASNGGVGEVTRCFTCGGTGRRSASDEEEGK